MNADAREAGLPKQAPNEAQKDEGQPRHLVIRETNQSEAGNPAKDDSRLPRPKPAVNDNSGGTGEANPFQLQTGEKQGIPSTSLPETSPDEVFAAGQHAQPSQSLAMSSLPSQPLDSYLRVLYCNESEIAKCEALLSDKEPKKTEEESFQ